MIDVTLSLLFAATAIAAFAVILVNLARLPGQIRSIVGEMGRCVDTREVRFTIRTVDVLPEGGTVIRGRFSDARRPARPLGVLPAAA